MRFFLPLTNNRQQRMTTILRWLATAFQLAFISWTACVTVWSYQTSRNSDGAWDESLWPVAITVWGVIGLTCIAVVFFLECVLAAYREHRKTLSRRLASVYIIGILAAVFGHKLGADLWKHEFITNQQFAENVVLLIESHQQEHGEYPDALSLAAPDTDKPRYRGRHAYFLEYERKDSNSFRLCYSYGWYFYTYTSQTQRWICTD